MQVKEQVSLAVLDWGPWEGIDPAPAKGWITGLTRLDLESIV
jgi:hypothetical protein